MKVVKVKGRRGCLNETSEGQAKKVHLDLKLASRTMVELPISALLCLTRRCQSYVLEVSLSFLYHNKVYN
jgi:hypothetical protein